MMFRRAAILCALAVLAAAQFPGQYPRRPSQIPGNPLPRRGSNPGESGRKNTSRNEGPLVTTTLGILRRATSNQLVIESDDHRIVWYRMDPKVTVTKQEKEADLKSFALGDYLSVDSTADLEGNFAAVTVQWKKDGTPADKAAAMKTWDLPRQGSASASKPGAAAPIQREPGDDRPVMRRKNPQPESIPEPPAPEKAQEKAAAPAEEAPPPEPVDNRPATTLRPPDPVPDDDDPGRPALRRGASASSRAPARTASAASGASAGGPIVLMPPAPPAGVPAAPPNIPQNDPPQNNPPQDDPVIAKAREAVASFSGSLPNFLVQQMTTRYSSETPKQNWQPLDIVTADLTYEDGRETFKNIKVGNKAVNKSMDEIDGTHSTGQFAGALMDVMDPGTAAVFRRTGQETLRGRSAWVYKYEVPRDRSHWRVEAPSQLYYPAHRGSLWIDKETSRVLRLEQESRNMPLLFPFDTVETATDYDFVRLGTTGPFLLPVGAEVLDCQRGTSICSRNKIEFRNYRKFGAESNVTFDDKL